MNIIEYLLTSLSEECAEIIQDCAKSQRFGLDDVYPKKPELGTNFDRLQRELDDLEGIKEVLAEYGVNFKRSRKRINEKKVKIKNYMEYARSRKTLKD